MANLYQPWHRRYPALGGEFRRRYSQPTHHCDRMFLTKTVRYANYAAKHCELCNVWGFTMQNIGA